MRLYVWILSIMSLFLGVVLAFAGGYSLDGFMGKETFEEKNSFLTYEITGRDAYSLFTFEILPEQDDSFRRWLKYTERKIALDRWEVMVEEEEHEIKVDLDLSDDIIHCGDEVFAKVTILNGAEIYEENLRVILTSDELGLVSEKYADVEGMGRTSVLFPVSYESGQNSYDVNVEVYREESLEGKDSEKLNVICR